MTNEEKFKKIVQIVKNVCSKRKQDLNLSEIEIDRLRDELKFFSYNVSLIDDAFDMIRNKKFGGTENRPNSIVFYVLGITNKRPDVDKEFCFNFDLGQKRMSPPDIDIDFDRREEILQHLCEKYGNENVALIGTAITFKPKAAVQFAAKALDVTGTANIGDKRFSQENDKEAKRISKIMMNLPNMTIDRWLGEDEKFEAPNKRIKEAQEHLSRERKRYPKVFETASKLEGMIKAFGTHAAGVVVSSRPLKRDVPLYMTKIVDYGPEYEMDMGNEEEKSSLLSTMFDMEDVESLGLLKFDFLQLDNLRQMSLCEQLIKESHGELNFNLDSLETNDPKVFKTIDDGKLEGLFQISGRAFSGFDYPIFDRETGEVVRDENGKVKTRHQKGVMEIIGCSNFNDIVVSNAIGRPGPLANDMHFKYRDGKEDPSSVTYAHPKLKSILEETYGQLCVSGDTEVYDARTNTFGAIRDFYHNNSRIDIQTQDKDGKEVVEKDREIINKGVKKVIRLNFEDGSRIDCTPDHKLWSEHGWIAAEDCLNKNMAFSKIGIILGKKKYSSNLARLIGMMLGDGEMGKHKNVFCAKNNDYLDFFESLVKKCFPSDNVTKYFNCSRNYASVNSGKPNVSSEMLKFNRKIGIQDRKSCEKIVPEYMFTGSEFERTQFIMGYFDTDGHIGIGKNNRLEVSFKSVSRELILGIKKILHGLGWDSKIYSGIQGETTYYLLDICDKYNFVVNFLSNNYSLKGKSIYEIRDRICDNKHIYRYNLTTFDRKKVMIYIESMYPGLSKRGIEKVTGFNFRYHSNSKYDRIRIKSLSKIDMSGYEDLNYNWKKVVSIEDIGQIDVYDIYNVGDSKRFSISNGLVVSNCYQEQLIKMAMSLALFTFNEADKLRKACAKKKTSLLAEIEPKFREGCKKNNIPKHVVDSMWKLAVDFGEYAFNKAHSTAYGYITYQTAYLKTYYPTEFICSILSSIAQKKSDTDLTEKINKFKKEYPKLKILPPDLNKSKNYYVPTGKFEITSPFVSMKGVGKRVSDHIVANQPYSSISDFIMSTSSSIVDQKTLETLISVGAFKEFGSEEEIKKEFNRAIQIKKMASRSGKSSSSKTIDLF